MIDVKNKKCITPGCPKQPIFNKPGETAGLYCAEHKHPGMINVKNKKCITPGCPKQPDFNQPGEPSGLYCAEHKQPGMIDVKNKKCQEDNCETRPSYGYLGQRPIYCAQHAPEDTMVNPKRRCEVSKCKNWAQYGIAQNAPERCEEHKEELDRDLVKHRCNICLEPALTNEEGACVNCDQRGHNLRLLKQRYVKAFLSRFPNKRVHLFKYDKTIDHGVCGKERPDFMWDCGTHYVILEVDEDQHKGYACDCEQTRMINITQSLGMPCYWIRYNPDHFTGQKSSLRDKDRLDYLARTLIQAFDNVPKSTEEYLRVRAIIF